MEHSLTHADQFCTVLDRIDGNDLPVCQAGVTNRLARAAAGPGCPENERKQN
jgi:hypothetical protein